MMIGRLLLVADIVLEVLIRRLEFFILLFKYNLIPLCSIKRLSNDSPLQNY